MAETQEVGDRIVIDDPGYAPELADIAWWNEIMNSRKIDELAKPIFIFSKLSEA